MDIVRLAAPIPFNVHNENSVIDFILESMEMYSLEYETKITLTYRKDHYLKIREERNTLKAYMSNNLFSIEEETKADLIADDDDCDETDFDDDDDDEDGQSSDSDDIEYDTSGCHKTSRETTKN
jgi:phosphopantothenoylcysteine synthetase/decarboxylase